MRYLFSFLVGFQSFIIILLDDAVESIFLAFLHCFVMLGSTVAVPTVIVPLMGGGKEENAQLILNFIFTAGITTLLHSYVGMRLPVVMGNSYAYFIPAISVAMSKSFGKHDQDQFKDSIRAIQGSVMAAGIFQIVFSFTEALQVYWSLTTLS